MKYIPFIFRDDFFSIVICIQVHAFHAGVIVDGYHDHVPLLPATPGATRWRRPGLYSIRLFPPSRTCGGMILSSVCN